MLSRKAAVAYGGVSIYLQPKLANDSLDLEPIFEGLTAENFSDKSSAVIAKIQKAVDGHLLPGAKIDGLKNVFVALDEMEPEEAQDEESEEEREKKAKEAEDRAAKDRKAKDRKARDSRRTARDAANEGLKSFLKDKMKAEDWKAACDEIDEKEKKEREAEDAEEEDLDPDPEKTNKGDSRRRARDAEPEGKGMKAEDVKKAMDEAIEANNKRHQAIRDAERAVRPWVGEMTMAFDTAEDVYRHALKSCGNKSAADVKELSALKALLELTPKPGSHRPSPPVAMDSASARSFETMFPEAMKVRIGA